MRYDCIRKEDISGIASCVFTKNGQGEEEMILDTAEILFNFNTVTMLESSSEH